jgi:hypothetical protein
MSVGTQWDLVHSTHLEDRTHSTVERVDVRRKRLERKEVDHREPLGSARGAFNGAILGAAVWVLIIGSAFALQSLIFG